MAQCTIPFSVGGSILENSTTNSLSSDQANTESTKSSDTQQINGCGDEPPMEEVIVYGHATSFSWGFIRFWWSPSPGGSGGGTSTTTFANVDANKACQALGAGKRQDLANLAFIAERSLAFKSGPSRYRDFLTSHPHGSTYEFTLPSGAVIIMIVSAPDFSLPLMTEAINSCG